MIPEDEIYKAAETQFRPTSIAYPLYFFRKGVRWAELVLTKWAWNLAHEAFLAGYDGKNRRNPTVEEDFRRWKMEYEKNHDRKIQNPTGQLPW